MPSHAAGSAPKSAASNAMRASTPWSRALARATSSAAAEQIDGADPQVGPGDRERDGHAAAAGARVDHRSAARWIPGQRGLDEPFGLGPGDQHPRVDQELETAELDPPGDVLRGLAPRAPCDPDLEAPALSFAERLGAPHQKTAAVGVQQVGQELFRLAPRVADPRAPERIRGGAERLGDRRRAQAWTSWRSRSAWSCATSSATSPSISPPSTAGRLCTVRPIRWSVTRFCGKL